MLDWFSFTALTAMVTHARQGQANQPQYGIGIISLQKKDDSSIGPSMTLFVLTLPDHAQTQFIMSYYILISDNIIYL